MGGIHVKIGNPFKAVANVARDVIHQPLKGITEVATAPVNLINRTTLAVPGVQKILDNKTVDQITFGASGDLAGTSRLLNEAGTGQHLQKEDINDFLRLSAKAGAGYGFATALGGGFGTGVGNYAHLIADKPITSFVVGQGINANLKRGNVAGVVDSVGGTDFLNDQQPGAGDWFNSILPSGPRQPSGGGSLAQYGPSSDVFGAASKGSLALPVVAFVVVIGIAYLAARHK
jgi:hypothetical protein